MASGDECADECFCAELEVSVECGGVELLVGAGGKYEFEGLEGGGVEYVGSVVE